MIDIITEYNIDVNVTKQCTMNCDYCFATKDKETDRLKQPQVVSEWIDRFLTSDFFTKNYQMLALNLWGGEPTMELDTIEHFCRKYKNDQRVRLFIFTNGYNMHERFEKLLKTFVGKYIGPHPKLCIQLSYDGMPIHDIKRTAHGKLTSDEVRGRIKWCDRNKVPFVIKSTVTPDTFKYMHDAYKDIFKLYTECTNDGFYKNINYFPTIDQYASDIGTRDHVKYCRDLESNLIDISTHEIHNRDRQHFFTWFNSNRAKCTAGKHSIAIDCDGEIYVCHGAMYGENKEHNITRIIDTDWESKLSNTVFQSGEYKDRMNSEPDSCQECPVEFCIRCNHAKYNFSEIDGFYLDKWFDLSDQPQLCDYYYINNNVKKAMYNIRRKI